MTDVALQVSKLEVRYGPVRAVQGVDLAVAAGSVTTLLGANGAGKTTALMAVAVSVSLFSPTLLSLPSSKKITSCGVSDTAVLLKT